MALVYAPLLRWELPYTHSDNRYFLRSTDFGFKGASTRLPMLKEHLTHGYCFASMATILRADDGLLLLHSIDESIAAERETLELIRAGKIYLSPGVEPPGRDNTLTLGLPRAHYATPKPVYRFPLAEASYTQNPSQEYLLPAQILI